jgi:hypothetical protein
MKEMLKAHTQVKKYKRGKYKLPTKTIGKHRCWATTTIKAQITKDVENI